jgi:CSLREA domain-containing protein
MSRRAVGNREQQGELEKIGTRVDRGRIGALALLFLGAAGLSAVMPATASARSSIQLEAPVHVQAGRPFDVVLRFGGGAQIGGVEAEINFDTDAAEFASADFRRNRLRGFPGALEELGPVELPDGVAVGFYSCPSADCAPRGLRAPIRGAKVGSVLARVRLTPLVSGRLEVRLGAVEFVAPDGTPLPLSHAPASSTVRVGSARELHSAPAPRRPQPLASPSQGHVRDVSGDSRLDEQDVTEVALQWIVARNDGSTCGKAAAVTRYDANQDGCLDVSDVQTYAGRVATRTATRIVAAAINPTLVVDSPGDGTDVAPGNGVCRTAASTCTLRAAIVEANAQSGANEIDFAIPGSGVQTIQLGSQLPTVTDTSGPTTIDGYTQPGASPNSNQFASNAQLRIAVRGTGSHGVDALRITSPNNVVRGMSFYNLRRSIWLAGGNAKGNRIVGNFVGTDPSGTFGFAGSALDLDGIGVELSAGANHNTVGEASLSARNVISGNARHGIACYSGASNTVYNNIVGLSPLGDRRLMNVKHGSDWNSVCANNVIGGTGSLQRNIFSGNGVPNANDGSAGVEVSHGPGNTGQQIVGNCFGTDITCTSAPSWTFNAFWGIHIEDTASNVLVDDNVVVSSRSAAIKLEERNTTGNIVSNNLVGVGPDGRALPNHAPGIIVTEGATNNRIGPGNIVAHNPVGVRISDAGTDGNTITRNSIFANGGLGIDLDPTGVTPNDAGDGDSGPNQQLNFPVLSSATGTSVRGTACSGCRVEVFVADPDPSGFGEGRTFLAAGLADASGNFTVSISGVSAGQTVTATATDGQGNTSEFAKRVSVG